MARETPRRKVRAPRAGPRATPDPAPGLAPAPGPTPAAASRSDSGGLGTGPARSGRSPGTRPAREAPRPPPGALTHRRRRHQGVVGGPEGSGEGLPPPAGRAPAPSPRPRARPARPPGNAMERGACAPGAGPAGGGGRADSGLRNARGPPGPSHLLREGRWALLSPVWSRGDSCGWGSWAPWPGRGDLLARRAEPPRQRKSWAPQPLPDSRVRPDLILP